MFVRKVRTASGAVAVQVMRKAGRRDVVVEHVGSAHTDAELGVLLERARWIVAGDQDVLDFEVSARAQRVADVADWRTGTLTLAPGVPKGAPVAPGPDRGDQFPIALRRDRRHLRLGRVRCRR